MGRRNNDNLLNVLFDVAKAVPWWVSIVIAAVSYAGFHSLAASEVAVDPQRPLDHMLPMVIRGVSAALQYLVPGVFLIGSVASVLRKKKREQLVSDAALNPETIRSMSWQEFEMLVGQAFRSEGYRVRERGGPGADGGIDLMLHKEDQYLLVQCKHWRASKVSVSIVRELQGVIATVGATGGFVVTSGEFTEDAKRFASETNIQLLDGEKLSAMLMRTRAGSTASHYNQGFVQATSPDPSCPRCGSLMVKRKAKRGDYVGQLFYGCSRYPSCRGMRNL